MSAKAWINFIKDTTTIGSISRDTGISVSRLTKIAEGLEKAGTVETKNIRNLYQRTSYSRLRDTGFSVKQADRFKRYGVSGVMDKINNVTQKITQLAHYETDRRFKKATTDWSHEQWFIQYKKAYKDIQIGFRASQKTYEEWINY